MAVADKNSDGGYRILAVGNYTEVKELEQLYNSENEGFDRYAKAYKSIKRTSDNNLCESPNREMLGRNSGVAHTKQEGVKGNTSTENDEYVLSDNRKTSDGIKLSDRDIDTQINQSMTMDEAKQMIQRAFVLGGIQEWYDGEYKNGDEWLQGEGVDEVALYIENEYTLQEKYLNKIQGIIDDEFYVVDVLEAYQNGTLVGKEKAKAKRLDVSVNHRVNDTRFYSPQHIENVKQLFDVANQKLTTKNRSEVTSARAKILIFAHNPGASVLLGLSQAELNKKLRSWSGYTAGAREASKRLNKGVADSNKWTGIENCSWLYKNQVTTEELESLVKNIEGAASDYEKLYVARTMLALDTHIDWSWLSFEFDTFAGVNKKQTGSGKCNGFYRNDARKIVVSHNKPHTVAHEMGHALDYQWGRDLGFSHSALTDTYRNTERITDADTKQFFDNFKIFLDSLTNNGDIRSEYTQDPKEVFARFVARFVQWVDNTGGNHTYTSEMDYYNDKFTASNYIEFVKLLQEKAMLDAKKMEAETTEEIKFSARDEFTNIEDDPLYPSSERERSAFNRSFANKTSNLKNMEMANIMIYTANNAYFISANGYMSGKIVAKSLIDGNEKTINEMRKEFENGTFISSERTDLLIQSIRNDRGRGYRRHASLKEILAAEGYEDMDRESHISNDRRSDSKSTRPSKKSEIKTSDRDSTTTTRSILANALESVAQNDIEKNKLAEYKEKISQIESEEQRLSEIQNKLFTKDGVEPSKRRELQFEAKQIANRINTYDRQLLRLEATKPLQNVLNREKALAMKRQKQKDNEYLKQYKAEVAKATRELITRNQESRKKAVDSRKKTAMIHEIKNTHFKRSVCFELCV